MQMPHAFLKEACKKARMTLPGPGEYGSGLVFLPRDRIKRRRLEERFEQIVQSEGQTILGWRTVPVDNSSLGETAKSSEPMIRQVFVGRDPETPDAMAFERKLYVIRKRAYSRDPHLDHGRRGVLVRAEPLLQDDRLQGHAPDRAARASTSPTCRTRRSRPRWRSCTRASAPTPSRAGTGRTRTATSPTTARSTPCAATSTGCTRARRSSSPSSSARTSRRSCRS